ncbi:MAG: DUF4184 family protein [Verrucomicrobia bacterium]|nr:DUF4184 family protein [Verrucomicrobiota bacterium]
MPFPLAHPAAVLPLRRVCPRWLSFPALVIGSLTPDGGYLFGARAGGSLSHQFLGSFTFCLPLGLVLVVLFYVLRSPGVRLLPMPYQRALLPLCQMPRSSAWGIVVSLLIGAWTHLLWDSFTHIEGWGAQHLPILQSTVFTVRGRTVQGCHLLWYGCSFAGMIWLFLVFEKWKQACVNGGAYVPTRTVIRDAVLITILVLPIELIHHFAQGQSSGLYLIATLCALPAIGIALKVGNPHKSGTTPKP